MRTLTAFVADADNVTAVSELGLVDRLAAAEAEATRVCGPDYLTSLIGTLGRQPLE